MVYSKRISYIKGWADLFTLPQLIFLIASCSGLLVLFWSFAHMACFGFRLDDVLPSWLKRFFAFPSSGWSYTSSSRKTSSPERSSSRDSCRSSVNWRLGYMSKFFELPCPDPVHLPQSTKSSMEEVDEYKRWRPFSSNRTPPLPMTRSQARCKPFAVYSPDLSMLSTLAWFFFFLLY